MQLTTRTPAIRKGDMVQIIAGKEKGKTGKVLRVLREKNRVLVEKLNVVKRHSKPTQSNPQGGVTDKEASLHISNVLLLCPKTNKGTRVSRKREKGKLVRVSKRSGGEI